jgi:hypothetical protein
VGVAAGGVGDGEFDEAPTLPQPAIARIATAEATTAGVLWRCKNTRIAVTFAVTWVRTDFLGFIDEWLFLKRKGRGNGGTSFASFGVHNTVNQRTVCAVARKDAAALDGDAPLQRTR